MPTRRPIRLRAFPFSGLGASIRRAGGITLAACLLWLSALSAQQTGQVTGVVLSRGTGQPIAAVQISIPGTGLGQLTNQEGEFLIPDVPAGEHVVAAELIGYALGRRMVSVPPGGTAVADFSLLISAVQLEGIVVTGTPIATERREVGHSIAVITEEQIDALPGATVEEILRGRVLGLTVSGSPSQPGAGSRLLLRGIHSVNGRNEPLVYVDGMRLFADPYEGEGGSSAGAAEAATGLGSIDPRDIDRIEVIKGAAASTLYGTEAAAGVIQIFTKRGTVGAPRWTFDMDQSLTYLGHVGPEGDPTGLHLNDCTTGGPLRPDQTEPDDGCPQSGSWLKLGHEQTYDVSVRGGSEDLTYFLSTGWDKQLGNINIPPPNEDKGASRYTFRGNFSLNGFEDLGIRLNSSYTRRDIQWIANGDNNEGFLRNVTALDDDETGEDDALLFAKEMDQIINQFSFSANFDWTPMENLRHRLNVGMDWSNSHFVTYRPVGYFDDPEGTRTLDIENRRLLTFDYATSYSSGVPLLGDDFTSVLSAGGQYNATEHTGNRTDVSETTGPGDRLLGDYAEVSKVAEDYQGRHQGGVFLQGQLGWKSRAFLTAGFRADSHSNFGENLEHRYFFLIYPKIQATYSLSDHGFWPGFWETSRVRFAYGEAGEPPPPGESLVYWNLTSRADEQALAFRIENQGNDRIGPEVTKEWEIGLDGSFLQHRLQYEATGFLRKTIDGLRKLLPPSSMGVNESVFRNIGDWEARGFETALDVVALDRSEWRVILTGRYQWNTTKLVKLSNDPDDTVILDYGNRHKPGQTMPSYINYRITNGDSLGVLPEYTDTMVAYGPTYPPHEASFDVTADLWDRITFNTSLFAQWGHVIQAEMAADLQGDELWPACQAINEQVEAYLAEDPGASIANLKARDIARCSRRYSDNEDWVGDGGHLSLGTTSLSFRVPERWLTHIPGGIEGATIRILGQNLLSWDRFVGLHPDALMNPTGGVGRVSGYVLPPGSRFTLNLRLHF